MILTLDYFYWIIRLHWFLYHHDVLGVICVTDSINTVTVMVQQCVTCGSWAQYDQVKPDCDIVDQYI